MSVYDQKMRQTEPEALAAAIGVALGAGDGTSYKATTSWFSGGKGRQYRIFADPRGLLWSSEDLSSGVTHSFDPETMKRRTGTEELATFVQQIPFSFHESVKLAFPLSLAIWGRRSDTYVPIAVEETDERSTLLLRHQQDRALFGSASFDPKSGRMMRLALPDEVWLMSWDQEGS